MKAKALIKKNLMKCMYIMEFKKIIEPGAGFEPTSFSMRDRI